MNSVKRVGSSFHREFMVLGVILSLAMLALVVGSRSSAHEGRASAARKDKRVTQKVGPGQFEPKFAPANSAPLLEALPQPSPDDGEDDDEDFGKVQPARGRSEEIFGPFDYDLFVEREKAGEFPFQGGPVPSTVPFDGLINNNAGATGTGFFTQSETTVVAFGSTVVVGFNDSGSNAGGTNKFTGFSRSTDGGATFTDGGTLPTNPGGDAGDPVLARDETTGRIYFATLGFSVSTDQVFHSDDNGATWSPPVNGTPGGTSEDKEWIAVDNFSGAGNGNVYLMSRRFGGVPGIYMFRSTDQGNTFGPTGGTQIDPGSQGSYVTVGPDHSVYAFWFAGTTLQLRKSTDFGVTFGPAVTVASGLVGGTNGDLGLTGIRQGTSTASGFRSSEFPHVAVNPVSGNLYVTYDNKGAGTDKADIFLVQSTTGGASWGAPIKINDDSTTTDQFQPTIAASTDGTRLGVFYYSRQEDTAGNNLFRYYGRIGTISGSSLTFLPSFAVSDTPSLPEFGRDSVVNSVYMGDYNTAFATPGFFHAVWSDNRDDLPGGAGRKDPNVYYERIPLGLAVTTTVPVVGSIISTQPTVFTVNVTDPVDPATLQASDFLVNGIPATSVSYTPGSTTMTFTFGTSPVTTQGLQTMHISGGAFLRSSDASPVLEFNGTFRYDTVLLQVVSTSPPFPNGVFTLPGPFTYDVNFNEAIDPASVQTTDLTLSGISGSVVTAVSVLPGNITARFTINTTAEGALTASIAAGAITDQFGNPGAAFSAVYQVDIGTVPYPTPLLAKDPLGSLIYDPSISGTVSFAGDTDSFTLAVDPGQTLTVLVTATSAALQPAVTLRDPSNAIIASATAGAAGQNALIQTAPAVTAGTYTMTVAGAGGTTGNYTVQVILNASKEAEGTLVGITNNTLATAQDINSSFITLQTSQASAQRGAVNGTADGANYSAAAVPFSFEDISTTGTVIAGLTNQDDTSVSIPIGFSFSLYGTSNTAVFVSSNGLLTFGTANSGFTNADLTTTPTQAAIAPFWDDQHTGGGAAASNVFSQVIGSGGNQHLTIQWNQVRFFSGGTTGDTITYEAQLFADGRIQFNYLDLVSGTAPGNNGASATVGIKAFGTQGPDRLLLAFNNGPNAFVGTGQSTLLSPPNPTPDFYSFSLSAGDVATLGTRSLSGGSVNVDLLDSGGLVLATGGSGSTNLDSVVSNFTASGSGPYYARVTSSVSVPYNLVVTRNAAFDTEANDTFATAQPIDGNRGVLGALLPNNVYQASAVPFEFEDISTTGTVIAGLTNQDDTAVSIPIGFSFSLYGTSNTDVFVSSNGLLTFGTANTTFTNADLTTIPAQAAIAPFWDDQHTGGGAAASNVFFQVVGSGANQHLTIQWNQVRFFSGGTTGDTITYEAQLFADGRIQFNYLDLVSGTAAGNNGASATVGIKASGTQGPNRLLLAFNNGPNAFVGTGQSTLITQPPSDDWYSVTLGGAQTSLQLETSTPADGPGEFVNTLNPHIELYSPANVLIASGIPLADGRNESLSASGLVSGAYRVRVSSEASSVGEYFLTTGAPPPISSGGSTLVNESCSPANGAIDPGERVSVVFRVTNNGASAVSNVIGTLQSTGGVRVPSGPQSYGTIASGATVGRQFSFTADPAVASGGTITATLQLQSGTTDLATLIYTFIAGPSPCGGVRLAVTSSLVRLNASTVRANIQIQNIGTLPADNAMLTSATLGSNPRLTTLPLSLGSIAAFSSVNTTVDFSNSTPGASVLSLGGTYTGGTFSSSSRVTIP